MSGLSALREMFDLLQNYGAEAQPKDAKAKTRARILRTATELFQQRGYRHVSVDDVARESGVAKGTVYVHFKNKAELLFHAIAEEKKSFAGQFLPLLTENLSPKKRLRRYLELSFLIVPRAPLISKLMSGDREMLLFLEELGPELSEQARTNQRLGMAALLEGVGSFDKLDEQEKAERITTLSGLVYAASQLMDERVRGGLSAEKYAAQLAKMIVEGIGAS